jgi:hypothetical protein
MRSAARKAENDAKPLSQGVNFNALAQANK